MIRAATAHDIPTLAALWHDGWRDGHKDHVPQALVDLRTKESFAERLGEALPRTWVAGADKAPIAFYILDGAELYQFYVGAAARGTGLAQQLIKDAEARVAQAGHGRIHLFVLPENLRARRFYEKSGWLDCATVVHPLDTSEGPFPLQVLKMQKVFHPI